MARLRRGLVYALLWMGLLATPLGWARPPGWVSGDSAKYPAEQYLVGRGVGSTESDAKNRARGDLAAIFEVRVEVATSSATTVSKYGKGEQVELQASQKVSAKTDKVISGIQIVEVWRDPVTKDFHALAVLPRAQASASLREEMGRLDEEIEQHIQAADAEKDVLLRIAFLTQARDAAVKRDGFQAMLKVVEPSGRGKPSIVSQASLQQQIGDALRQLRIAVAPAADAAAEEFAAVIKGGLAAAGLLPTKLEEAELVFSGNLALVDLGFQSGWYWVRATLSVTLTEKESGRVRGRKTWPVKASAQDPDTARSRAMIEVEKLFKSELRATLIDFALNPEGSH